MVIDRSSIVYAIVPVKPLRVAKGRLASVLSASERRALVLAMLSDVLVALRAARNVRGVGVVSRDAVVLSLAARMGAEALFDRASDLNGALAQASAYYQSSGASAVLVLPADIPLVAPAEIDGLIAAGGAGPAAVLAPSRDGGTNALLLRPPSALPFLFGPDSLARHRHAAKARGMPAHLFRAPGLELDVDRPDDLLLLAEAEGATAAQQLVREWNLCARLACV